MRFWHLVEVERMNITDKENAFRAEVTLAENTFGRLDIRAATALTDLSNFYASQGKHEEAGACNQRIQEILELWYSVCPNASAAAMATR